MDELPPNVTKAKDAYFLTTNTRTPFSAFRDVILPDLSLSFIVAVRPTSSLRLAFFIFYAIVVLTTLSFTTGDRSRDLSIGCSRAGQIFNAFHLLWLTDPLHEVRHEHDRIDPPSLPLFKRVYWSMCINYSFRGIGWNYQVANVPASPIRPRWHFVRHQLLCVLWWFLLIDISQTYIQSNSLFTHPRSDMSPFSRGYILRCINIVAWMTTPYSMFEMQYGLLSIAFVTLGISEPKYWPDMYGSWSDAFTIRRFWGRTWHQTLRRWLSSNGKYLTTLLGFKSGSSGSSYTQLYSAFVMSALMHVGGDLMVGREYLGASFKFFVLQAVVITAEDGIIALAKRAGVHRSCPESLAKLVGYVWVFLWFSLSTPWLLEWVIQTGFAKSQALPFSLIQILLDVFV